MQVQITVDRDAGMSADYSRYCVTCSDTDYNSKSIFNLLRYQWHPDTKTWTDEGNMRLAKSDLANFLRHKIEQRFSSNNKIKIEIV